MSRPPVLRNATLLVAAQAAAAPLAVLVNAVAARMLGAVDFGRYYQALTVASFAYLFVEWGQPNVLTARVATERAAAGLLLGSGILARVCAALVIDIVVPCLCIFAGCDRGFIEILSLALVGGTFATVAAACQDVFRGFERTDAAAASSVGWQLASAAVVVPTLLLGGGIRGLVIAQVACTAAGTLVILSMLPRMHVPPLAVRWAAVTDLLRRGQPFLWFAVVLALQPLVDAAMLAKFSAAQSLGWYAVARKLIGVLTYPACALTMSLYPTLCRLHLEDELAYGRTAAQAIYAATLVVIPLALGCLLFPALGVAIFGAHGYGPAEDDLRWLAPYVLLVFFSMPIGSCLASSGRQRAWTLLQMTCVVISAVCDPPLIRWFDAHSGNGGLGVCVSTGVSEMLMVAGGIYLLPKGILARLPRRRSAVAVLAGAVMTATACELAALDTLPRAVLSMLAYGLCVQLLRAASVTQMRTLLVTLRGGG